MKIKLLTVFLSFFSIALFVNTKAQNIELYNLSFVEAGGDYPQDTIDINNLIAGSTITARVELFNNTGSDIPEGDTLFIEMEVTAPSDTNTYTAPFVLQDTLDDQDTLPINLTGLPMPQEEGTIEFCGFVLNNPDPTDGSVCRTGTLNYSGDIETVEFHILEPGGAFPEDTLDRNDLRGGTEVDIRFTSINFTDNELPANSQVGFAIQMLNLNDTVTIGPGGATLSNPVPVSDSFTVRFSNAQLLNEDGLAILIIIPLDNDVIGDGSFGGLIEITSVFNYPNITELQLIEQGGSHPGDALNHDSIPVDSAADIHFEITNNNTFEIDAGTEYEYELLIVSNGDTTVAGNQTYTIDQELAASGGTASFTWENVDTPDETDDYSFCIRYIEDNNTLNCEVVSVTTPTGIPEYLVNSMNVYTAHDEVVIEAGEVSGSTHVALFDLTGKSVFNRIVNLTQNNIERFNVNELNKGIYIVRLSQGNEMLKSEKVILR